MFNSTLRRALGLAAVFAIALLVVARITVMDGTPRTDLASGSGRTAEARDVSREADATAPPGWIRYEDDLFEGWVHPSWVAGNIDLNHFVTDESLTHLAPLVRRSLTQQSDLLKDSTVIWVGLDVDEGSSGILVHGCLGPSGALGRTVTPEMLAEIYRALGMRADPAGTFKFGSGRAPVVRINEPPGDAEVLQATLMGKDCLTTAEFFAPPGDSESRQLFETFIENLRFKD